MQVNEDGSLSSTRGHVEGYQGHQAPAKGNSAAPSPPTIPRRRCLTPRLPHYLTVAPATPEATPTVTPETTPSAPAESQPPP